MAPAGNPRAGSGWPQEGTAGQAAGPSAGSSRPGPTGSPNGGPAHDEDGHGRDFTMTIPTEQIVSAATTAVMTPIEVARRILPAKGGLPVYAGLGGLALVGVLDWPVAVAAGAGYGLARLWGQQGQQDHPQPARPQAQQAQQAQQREAGAQAGRTRHAT